MSHRFTRHGQHDSELVEFRSDSVERRDACVSPDPANTVADRINTLLNSSGPGYTLSLCPGREYVLQDTLRFAAPGQEISTTGYPTDNSRALLTVNGVVQNGSGMTTAVDGTCAQCSGIVLRNIQINGARGNASPTNGGANIEFGGGNANQTVQFVRSFDPRSWSCLHIAEGPFTCTNVTIQNNDIGPCGTDTFQEWADGISVSCQNSVVRNNMVQGPTDGGIVLFGAPGTQVYNNTVWVTNHTLLGGINLVDYDPWQGNYTGTVVYNNTILGGYATSPDDNSNTKGVNAADAVVKIGIAIGPRTWFGPRYFNNVSINGVVRDNRLSGAFSYGIAVSSAVGFTVENNVLFGNTSFIGASGPNCSTLDIVPTPAPFVFDNSTSNDKLQNDFQFIADAGSLTCVLPPSGGDFWPYGGDPGSSSSGSSSSAGQSGSQSTSHSKGSTAGVVVGVIFGLGAAAAVLWFMRKWALRRMEQKRLFNSSKEMVPGQGPGSPTFIPESKLAH